MIRAILRALNGAWAWSWSLSPIGTFSRILDAVVDRASPPVDPMPERRRRS